MHECINGIWNAKEAEERYTYQKDEMEQKQRDITKYNQKLEWDIARVHQDLNKSEKALLDLAKHNDQVTREKKVEKSRLDDIVQKQMDKIKKVQGLLDTEINENIQNKKMINDLKDEMKNMTERIKVLKQKKGKIDLGLKTCKWCKKEYKEEENFNWKCITHRGAYSKEANQWWCCGKAGEDTPGCKSSKHEQKQDDDGVQILDKLKGQINQKNSKCSCCK